MLETSLLRRLHGKHLCRVSTLNLISRRLDRGALAYKRLFETVSRGMNEQHLETHVP